MAKPDKSVSHTNRRGKTYYLHITTTEKGATRFVLKTTRAGALDALPDGLEIVEGPNGEACRARAPIHTERQGEVDVQRGPHDLSRRRRSCRHFKCRCAGPSFPASLKNGQHRRKKSSAPVSPGWADGGAG